MKKVVLVITFLFVISLTTSIAENPVVIELTPENKTLLVEEYFPAIPVRELIEKHPEIEAISMQEYGNTFVYVDAFNGIGTNFLIEPSKQYEIHVSKKIELTLKG